jgi:hypothetical protein
MAELPQSHLPLSGASGGMRISVVLLMLKHESAHESVQQVRSVFTAALGHCSLRESQSRSALLYRRLPVRTRWPSTCPPPGAVASPEQVLAERMWAVDHMYRALMGDLIGSLGLAEAAKLAREAPLAAVVSPADEHDAVPLLASLNRAHRWSRGRSRPRNQCAAAPAEPAATRAARGRSRRHSANHLGKPATPRATRSRWQGLTIASRTKRPPRPSVS